jgi:hypothetical protein
VSGKGAAPVLFPARSRCTARPCVGIAASGSRVISDDVSPREHSMLDIIMLAIALGFFALSVGYAYACDRL